MNLVDAAQFIAIGLVLLFVIFQQRRISRLENLKILKDFIKSEKLNKLKRLK